MLRLTKNKDNRVSEESGRAAQEKPKADSTHCVALHLLSSSESITNLNPQRCLIALGLAPPTILPSPSSVSVFLLWAWYREGQMAVEGAEAGSQGKEIAWHLAGGRESREDDQATHGMKGDTRDDQHVAHVAAGSFIYFSTCYLIQCICFSILCICLIELLGLLSSNG